MITIYTFQGILSVIVLLINIAITIVAIVVAKRSEKSRQRLDSECQVPECPKRGEPRLERLR